MKILKYMIKPVFYTTLLCVILATLYFRSIIFHGNVNGYLDSADAYLEKQFKMDIPQYIVKTITVTPVVDEIECVQNNQTLAKTNNEITPAVTEQSIVEPDQAIVEVEQEVVIVKDKTQLLIDDIPKQQEESSVTVDLVKYEESLDLIKLLNETVGSLNKKVDALIENVSSSKDVAIQNELKQPIVIESNASVQKMKDATLPVDSNEKANDTDTDMASNNEPDNDVRQILTKARKMFWNGNAQGSEKLYLDLMAISNDDPDVYGELGNVYYAQGKWKLAGEAYYEAAVRLLDLNKTSQVGFLLRIIQGLDTVSADKLRQKMSG